jgi:hypothetical protein
MRSLMLGVLLGTIVALLKRLRLAAKIGTAETASTRAPAAAAQPPAGQSGQRGESPSDDLARLTRQELYLRAQTAGIVGRSQMSKQQLIAALRDVRG